MRKRRIAIPFPQPSIPPDFRKTQYFHRRLDSLQTAVVWTAIHFAYSWVADRGKVDCKFVGLLDAMGG